MSQSHNLPPLNDPRCALVVIDMQNDFIPGGQLAVQGGDEIVPLINRLGARFRNVVVAQDWHPAGHVSFASSHPGKAPFDSVQLPYGAQTLWPEHCVQGSHGAQLHADLNLPHAQLIVRKGFKPRYRQLLSLRRSRPTHAHRSFRLPEGAGDRYGLPGRPGAGLLRRVVGAGCTNGGLQHRADRRRLPGH